jgi:phosphatidylinositol-4,5-bisphosphate 3-kinase
MKWSLRDEKQMEELGFSKCAKGQRYFEMKKNVTAITKTVSSLSESRHTEQPTNDQFGSLQTLGPSTSGS